MTVEVNIWKSRFGKRIFVVFFIAALIPVLVLSYLALDQVNKISTQQISESLKQEAKFYGLSLYDRLLVVESELAFYLSKLKEADGRLEDLTFSEGYISGLYYYSIADQRADPVVVLGDFSERPVFNEQQMDHLNKDGAVLSLLPQDKGGYRVVMSRKLETTFDSLILVAELDREKLWGATDLFGDQFAMCVIKDSSTYLYCSNLSGKKSIKDILALPVRGNSLGGKAQEIEENMLLGGWSLFLAAKYQQPAWSIVLVKSKDSAYSLFRNFAGAYILVVVLILLLISALSVFLLRKNLSPLETLLNGIRDISNHQFNKIVTVNSGDEFSEVANTVNEMSEQISAQINTLKLQAQIDQNILSRSSLDDIINVTLKGLDRILDCDFLMVGILNKEDSSILEVKGRLGGPDQVLISEELELSSDDMEMLERRNVIFTSMGEGLVSKLQDLFDRNSHIYLLIPIIDADKLYGVLVLGMNKKPRAEILLQLQEFGARIAVAFSNAAWEDRLYLQAHHDLLTQLPNRMLLEERLGQEISRASRSGEYLAVLFLDLDRFKNVNDSLGHAVGDALLKQVAKRLTKCLRLEDMVSRLGGDEFVVVLSEMKTSAEAMTTAVSVAEKIIEQLTRPFKLNDYDARISTSVGISMFPDDGLNVDALIRGADSAMYHAKRQGGGLFQFYSESLNAEARYRLNIEYELYQALENDEFELYYQAKVDMNTGVITGAEALIRWQHPKRGLLLPDVFLPIAEVSGQIIEIEKWVFNTATRQAAEWKEVCGRSIAVAVNASAKHFHHGGLVDHLKTAIRGSGINPALLEVEVTESMAVQGFDQTISTMKDLAALGISISIDDFGTGYSSLSYLKHFPAETLKIDREFIKNLPEDRKDLAMVKSIVTMGHNLGLKIVAEGVETIEQLNVLRDMGCDEVQGFMYSLPVPTDQFCELIDQDSWEVEIPDLYL
jgi:diguanylate cyclase (GGDEF)-like protein